MYILTLASSGLVLFIPFSALLTTVLSAQPPFQLQSFGPSPPPAMMASPVAEFIDSLLLPEAQGAVLKSQLAPDPEITAFLEGRDTAPASRTSSACLVAQVALGAESVDTAPLNQSNVKINWSVSIHGCTEVAEKKDGRPFNGCIGRMHAGSNPPALSNHIRRRTCQLLSR